MDRYPRHSGERGTGILADSNKILIEAFSQKTADFNKLFSHRNLDIDGDTSKDIYTG